MNVNMLLYWMYAVRLNAPQRCAWQERKRKEKKKKEQNVDDDIRPNWQRMLLKRADRLTIIRIQSKNKEAKVTETSPLKRRVLQQVR